MRTDDDDSLAVSKVIWLKMIRKLAEKHGQTEEYIAFVEQIAGNFNTDDMIRFMYDVYFNIYEHKQGTSRDDSLEIDVQDDQELTTQPGLLDSEPTYQMLYHLTKLIKETECLQGYISSQSAISDSKRREAGGIDEAINFDEYLAPLLSSIKMNLCNMQIIVAFAGYKQTEVYMDVKFELLLPYIENNAVLTTEENIKLAAEIDRHITIYFEFCVLKSKKGPDRKLSGESSYLTKDFRLYFTTNKYVTSKLHDTMEASENIIQDVIAIVETLAKMDGCNDQSIRILFLFLLSTHDYTSLKVLPDIYARISWIKVHVENRKIALLNALNTYTHKTHSHSLSNQEIKDASDSSNSSLIARNPDSMLEKESKKDFESSNRNLVAKHIIGKMQTKPACNTLHLDGLIQEQLSKNKKKINGIILKGIEKILASLEQVKITKDSTLKSTDINLAWIIKSSRFSRQITDRIIDSIHAGIKTSLTGYINEAESVDLEEYKECFRLLYFNSDSD